MSIVLPGFLVIIVTLFFWNQKYLKYIISSSLSQLLLIFLLLGISYEIGILFLFLSDRTGICKTFYTKDSNLFREITKNFHEKCANTYPKNKEMFANLRERYIIFTQTCGNMTWASSIIIFIILIHYFTRFRNPYDGIFLTIFSIILVLTISAHSFFQRYLEEWDNKIIDC